jgi:hypothetical protein
MHLHIVLLVGLLALLEMVASQLIVPDHHTRRTSQVPRRLRDPTALSADQPHHNVSVFTTF